MLKNKIYQILKTAMEAKCLAYAPITNSKAKPENVQANDSGLSLFEYMTKNDRPEIRAQEAIYPYLLAEKFEVRREAIANIGNKRFFDFLVSDSTGEVILEFKHRSPHQTDKFKGLIGPTIDSKGVHLSTLHQDFYKPRPQGVPLIQLGLYTAIEGWNDSTGKIVPPKESGAYFVNKFVKSPVQLAVYAEAARDDLNNWEHRHLYTCPTKPATGDDFCVGPDSEYISPAGITIHGRVNYFLGIGVDHN